MASVSKDSTLGKVGEILAFSLVLGAVNYFFPGNPGLPSSPPSPSSKDVLTSGNNG